jgi:nucleotide-binding universal stress UspA family protein
MAAIRRLLCPVDLSEPSARALRYAAALRSVLDGELAILYVSPTGARQPAAKRSSDTSLETFASHVVDIGPSIRLLARQGQPVTEILHVVKAVAPDVVVMGTHGRTGLQRLLVGSVTERVIRRSPTPVLVVPPRFRTDEEGSIKLASVLCAVDFSESSTRAVHYAASIAAAARARFVLAHALEWSEEIDTLPDNGKSPLPSSEDDAIERMTGLVTDEMRVRCSPQLVVGYGPAADEVMRVVHEHHVDLVVLGVRRRNPIDLAVFGSTAQRLVRDGACAVLTVRSGSQ